MKSHAVLSLLILLALGVCSNPAARAVTIDWVTVGNPGNANDTTGFGSVGTLGGNPYRIGKYEVTNAQYTEFLNAVADTDTNALYSANMNSNPRGGITQSGVSGSFTYAVKTNMGNKPVNFVNFFDAMRFTNWLQNNQPTGLQSAGTTEAGVYTIGTGLNETRAGGASFFLPSEDEWYKAAYHQPVGLGGDSDNYWRYPTGSNTAPTLATASIITGDISNPGANVANYNQGADWNSQNGNVTTVGSAGLLSDSYYGTFDQGGNVMEWNEAIISPSSRGVRGGSWLNALGFLDASVRYSLIPAFSDGNGNVGFRVASPFPETAAVVVPEPSTFALLGLGAIGLAVRTRRRRTLA